MQTRSVFLTRLSALLLCLLLPTAAMAATAPVIQIKKGATIVPGSVYPNLEELRKAMNDIPPLVLAGGTQIVLYNDDKSLTEALVIPAGTDVTLKSVSGKQYTASYTGSLQETVIQSAGDTPTLNLQNVSFASSANYPSVGVQNSNTVSAGTLTITNGYFNSNTSSGYADIDVQGLMNTTITNTTISGTGSYGVGVEATSQASSLNLIFDENARDYSTWTKGIAVDGTGNLNMNVAVAKNKVFDMQGDVVESSTVNRLDIVKTGEGVWKTLSGSASSVRIDEGTFQIGASKNNYEMWDTDTFSVSSKGILQFNMYEGNLKEYILDRDNVTPTATRGILSTNIFNSDEGARTHLGGISSFDTIPYVTSSDTSTTNTRVWFGSIYVPTGTTANSTIASTMNINNKLMKATWHAGDTTQDDFTAATTGPEDERNAFILYLERVSGLGVLDGVGSWADTYRKMNLSDPERDMLDYIYNTGGGGYGLGYLQTIGGYHVQNSLIAMRHNQANFTNKINQRLTRYQKEELELNIESDELCDYSDYDPINEYGEMWAYMDQTWTNQDDVGSIAGHRYQAHTLGVGYDWHKDNWIWGGALSYAGGDVKLNSATSSRTDLDNLMLALYASWAQEGYYISGTAFAGYGWNESKSKFELPGIDTMYGETGNYGTSTFGANLEVGYMIETEFYNTPLRITPYGSATYARIHRNAARESGADNGTVNLNRQFHAANWPIWDTAIGVRLAAPISRCGYTLIPSLDLAWTRTMGDTDTGAGDVWFVRDPSSSWQIPTMGGNRSSLRVAANLDARIRDNLAIGGGYSFEWRKQSWSHQLNANISLGF